ncbi:AraC family transcriptional regulator [Radicibacter daui]|uniref:AraC family transcriptional regulator n=1 Tax=Radicibacter daui TaxID=3064829 RepID=UPI0040468E5E
MDPLSDILSLLRPRSVETYGLTTGGTWALDFPRGYLGFKFGAVVRGECWLRLRATPTEPEALMHLVSGDCYLLTGQPYWLGSDPALPGDDATIAFVDRTRRIARYGLHDDLFLVGGRMTFDDNHAALLTGVLPAFMHIPAAANAAAVLQWTLDQLARELADQRPGAGLMAEHLAHILFVNVLRAHMERQEDAASSWLRGLTDPRIARALLALHEAPAERWTLERLAGTAGMSRTAFALRFKALVGRPPLDYLQHWRMRLAARALADRQRRLSEIAEAVGYESESALSAAFKRVMGMAPRDYRAQILPQPA